MAEKAIARKTGARGLRSILETALLDTMFDLPEMGGVEGVVVNGEVIMQSAKPLLVHSEKSREPQKAGA